MVWSRKRIPLLLQTIFAAVIFHVLLFFLPSPPSPSPSFLYSNENITTSTTSSSAPSSSPSPSPLLTVHRLYFPFHVIEDGREKAQYNVEKGEISIFLPKLIFGQNFPDLDMLTKLLIKPRKEGEVEGVGGGGEKGDRKKKEMVEVIGSSVPGMCGF